LTLDICPGAPEFLVTPLSVVTLSLGVTVVGSSVGRLSSARRTTPESNNTLLLDATRRKIHHSVAQDTCAYFPFGLQTVHSTDSVFYVIQFLSHVDSKQRTSKNTDNCIY